MVVGPRWFRMVGMEPEEGIGALVGFSPSLEPRLQRWAHSDDEGGPAKVTGVAWVDLIAVGFAVRRNEVNQGNRILGKDLSPVSDDRKAGDHQGLGLGTGGHRRTK